MPLSSPTGSPKYPAKQRWSLVAERNSSGEDMVVQVGPDGHPSPGIVHSPSWEVEKRPIPLMPASHGHPPQAPWSAPATRWVFCKPKPSKSPTSVTFPLGALERVPSCSLLQTLNQPPEKQVTSGPNSSGFLKPRFWVATSSSPALNYLEEVILKVGGTAILRLHLAAPSLPSPRAMLAAIPAARVGLCLWPAPDEGAA